MKKRTGFIVLATIIVAFIITKVVFEASHLGLDFEAGATKWEKPLVTLRKSPISNEAYRLSVIPDTSKGEVSIIHQTVEDGQLKPWLTTKRVIKLSDTRWQGVQSTVWRSFIVAKKDTNGAILVYLEGRHITHDRLSGLLRSVFCPTDDILKWSPTVTHKIPRTIQPTETIKNFPPFN